MIDYSCHYTLTFNNKCTCQRQHHHRYNSNAHSSAHSLKSCKRQSPHKCQSLQYLDPHIRTTDCLAHARTWYWSSLASQPLPPRKERLARELGTGYSGSFLNLEAIFGFLRKRFRTMCVRSEPLRTFFLRASYGVGRLRLLRAEKKVKQFIDIDKKVK